MTKWGVGGVAAVAAVLLIPGGAGAQIGPGITESVVSRFDPTQRYAISVPSQYRVGAPHPLLVVLDSRGRALLPLERIAPAAERLGWIVMSSYQSRSDEDGVETDRAARAIIADAQDLFTIDSRRLYLAGLSGNARQSWLLAGAYEPYTAGVFGFGAALPSSTRLVELAVEGPIGFSFFGGAGEIDYNNYELRGLDWRLDEYGVAHFVSFYPGEHEWPNSAVFDHALEWMEVRAVRDGLYERGAEEITAFYERRRAIAERLEADGDPYDAWRVYRSLAVDFEGLMPIADALAQADRLATEPAFEAEVERLREEVDERIRFDDRLTAWIERVRRSQRVADVLAAVRDLDVRRLLTTSRDTRNPHRARVALEMLEDLFVQASFYQPRRYEALGRPDLMSRFFELARMIKPQDVTACLGQARSAAMLGQEDEAVDGLECAAATGLLTVAALDGDSAFAALRADARFTRVRARISY